ncbi:MAG: DNA-processing protein DprA [Acidimicrobiales bacterium]
MTAAEQGAWLVLLSVPGLGARRLWEVWACGDVVGEWERLRRGVAPRSFGSTPEQRSTWQEVARSLDPVGLVASHEAAGVSLTVHGDGAHPASVERDPHLPPALLWQGAGGPSLASRRPLVGIIGTRRATRYGLELATEFGAALTAAGGCVVSGLAAGVDAAAHRGALAELGSAASSTPTGAPLAVVGSGHDVPYPRSNRRLWAEVAASGAIVSEYPLGTPPAAWRFPARNRILAALCDAVVVVESHERGGSLITAGLAGARGVPVLAVPGGLRSAASVGCNRLIADGCQPCLGVDDVLTAVGLSSVRDVAAMLPFDSAPSPAPPLDERDGAVLDALGWERRSLDDLVEACPSLTFGAVALVLARLQQHGVVVEADGWFERCATFGGRSV